MAAIIRLGNEDGKIYLKCVVYGSETRVHLAKDLGWVGEMTFIQPQQRVRGFGEETVYEIDKRSMGKVAHSSDYARTFFPGCAGHWTAFRDRLGLQEEDIPVYKELERIIRDCLNARDIDNLFPRLRDAALQGLFVEEVDC